MSTMTDVTPVPAVRNDWPQVGAVAGAIFGVTSGLLFYAIDPAIFSEIGAYIAMPTLLGGALLHLSIGFVFALAFAGIVSTRYLDRYTDRLRTLVPVALAFGVVWWVVVDVSIFAYWGVAMGIPGAVFPDFAPEFLVVGMIHSVILALAYYATRRLIITGRAVQ